MMRWQFALFFPQISLIFTQFPILHPQNPPTNSCKRLHNPPSPKVTNSFLKSRIYRIYRIHRIYRIAASAKPAIGDGELLQNNKKIGCANCGTAYEKFT
ncbi:MAG: hypothetical protein PUE25_03000 [bacterium]|nr:hypothetical protein [bacterium]